MAKIGFMKLYLGGFRPVYTLEYNRVLHLSTENGKLYGYYMDRLDGRMVC